jgi:HSP20 family protein
MSNLIPWRPFDELLTLRDATDLAIDICETGAEVVVKTALPGFKPDEVEVTITGSTLTISGESKEENETKEKDYIRKERRFGSFTHTVTLPNGLKADKAEAVFQNGMLALTVPKSEESKPKSIKINAK